MNCVSVCPSVPPSGIRGVELECIYPKDPSQASPYETRRSLRHAIFTAETHNFPTGRDAPNTIFTSDLSVTFFPHVVLL